MYSDKQFHRAMGRSQVRRELIKELCELNRMARHETSRRRRKVLTKRFDGVMYSLMVIRDAESRLDKED